MQANHDSLHKQIADAERAIWSGDERRSRLKAALKQRAKQGFSASRGRWLMGGVALAAAGLLLYPRRKNLMSLARTVLSHPIGMALLQRSSWLGMALPWINRLMARH